jgi:hypothetical protein
MTSSITTPTLVRRTITGDPYSRIAAMDRLIELNQGKDRREEASPAVSCRRENEPRSRRGTGRGRKYAKATVQEVLPLHTATFARQDLALTASLRHCCASQARNV